VLERVGSDISDKSQGRTSRSAITAFSRVAGDRASRTIGQPDSGNRPACEGAHMLVLQRSKTRIIGFEQKGIAVRCGLLKGFENLAGLVAQVTRTSTIYRQRSGPESAERTVAMRDFGEPRESCVGARTWAGRSKQSNSYAE